MSRPRAYALLALAILLFGSLWPVLKLGLGAATPVWFAAGRAGTSALTAFLLLAALGRLKLPGREDWPIVLSIGGLQLASYFALANMGLALLPAGRSAVLGYSTPLWTIPLAWPLLGERPRQADLVGLACGLAGLAVLAGPVLLEPQALAGHGLLLAGALAWALAMLHARGHGWRLTPLDLLPWQMGFASLLLIGFALWREPTGGIALTPAALLPLLYVGAFAGPLATWSSTHAIRALPAAVSSLGFLVTPALSVLGATLALGEPLTWDLLTGGGLILLGVAATLRR